MKSTLASQGALADVWAKSPAKDADRGELLTDHLLAVAQRMLDLFERRTQGAPWAEGLNHIAFWSAVLHDAGKIGAHFQELLRGIRRTSGYRHELLSLLFIRAVACTTHERSLLIASVASHHKNADHRDVFGGKESGKFQYLDDLENADLLVIPSEYGGEIDAAQASALTRFIALELPERMGRDILTQYGIRLFEGELPFIPTRGHERGKALLVGLRTYRDVWQCVRNDPPSELAHRAMLLRGLLLQADRIASAGGTKLAPLLLPTETEAIVGAGRSLRPHQREASEKVGSLVLRAPTGSGKTEAALLWARRQQRRRLIYVLPFQASLNAMQSRLQERLDSEVGLLHARALSALLQAMGDDVGSVSKSASAQARRARDFARLFAQPIVVATPYQLLRAAYGIRGYPAIWSALETAALVLDEVHAYDPKRSGLILGLIEELRKNWCVDILAMSATLPSWFHRLLGEVLAVENIPPLVPDSAALQRHRLEHDARTLEDDSLLDEIARIGKERTLLVVANTVKRAMLTYERLIKRCGAQEVALLHSRFTGRDRIGLEERVRAGHATDGGTRTPRIVIATQVVEVSLDVDFEILVTELAPMEALVQRFGRVNRVGRRPPARILVIQAEHYAPYEAKLVITTGEVLEQVYGSTLDEARLAELLDEVYERSGIGLELETKTKDAMRDFRESVLGRLDPYAGDEELSDGFDGLFDGMEVLAAEHAGLYGELLRERPLEAATLTIPLSGFTYRAACANERIHWDRERKIAIADAPYDPARGLLL